MIVKLALSVLASLILTHYLKLSTTQSIITAVACFVVLFIIDTSKPTTEGFSTEGDTTRYVRFGDRILFWTHKNRMMNISPERKTGVSAYLSQPEEVPRNWVWEFMRIENGSDNRWMAGSETPVKFGDKIHLRTWLSNPTIWLSPGTDVSVGGSQQRANHELLTIESPDVSGRNGKPIRYGDSVYLKTWRGMYLSLPETGADAEKIVQVAQKDSTCLFRLYDDYGQAQEVDWATRGTATQAKAYPGAYIASNAINGNLQNTNHTDNVQGAWWQVELPRDINVSNITIVNRKDCCQDRLQDFDVIILNNKGQSVYSKHFQNSQAEYKISGIGRTGRVVKVQLRGKNYLHMARVSVYGTPINYSSLMETPVVADLLTKPMDLTDTTSKTFHNESIPYVGKNNSMSMSLFVHPSAGNTGSRNIVTKGNVALKLQDSKLAISAATAAGAVDLLGNAKLTPGTWNHVAISIRPKISPSTGWVYGEFTSKPAGITEACCYILHPQRKEYYRLPQQGQFASATKHQWSAGVVQNMTYRGSLSHNVPTLTVYINGNLDAVHKLDSDAVLGNDPIVIGQVSNADKSVTKGMSGKVHSLRVYNYDITTETAQRDSRSQHGSQTLDLVRKEHDAGTPMVFDANKLPTISSEVSASCWVLSNGATKKWQSVFWNGNNDKDRVFGLWLTPAGNFYSSVRTYGGSTGAGVREVKYSVKPNTWYHVSIVFKDRTQSFYVNGNKVASVELPGDVQYDVSPLTVGSFAGKVKNLKYHNFALSSEEVRAHMGVHPDYKIHESIQKIWKEQGCVTNLFADLEVNTDLVDMVKTGEEAAMESKLRNMKAAAHKGDKKMLVQCYGPYASKLFAKLQKSGELLDHSMKGQGKQCLPTAPFECKTKNVNDFDIRTHKDFHKYTLVDKIIPPAGSMNDVNIVDHPDFDKYMKQLTESKKALAEMSKIRVQSEAINKELTKKISELEKKNGFTKDDVVKHPLYKELLQKFNSEKATLVNVKKEQTATLKAMRKADLQARNVSQHPEFKRIATELKNARKLAMANLAQNMDLETLRENPLFREILKGVMGDSLGKGPGGKSSGSSNMITLERDLRAQKKQMEKIRSDTLHQLQNTKHLADNIYRGIATMDSKAVDNVILAKQDLSDNPEFQDAVDAMKKMAGDEQIKKHPEYQKLVQKLNKLTVNQVEGESPGFQDFKVQSHKCAAMFEEGAPEISNKTLLKIFKDRVATDPQFQALMNNVIETKTGTDRDFSQIMKKAQNEKYTNDPRFRKFLLEAAKEHLKNDPVYRKTVASMIGVRPGRRGRLRLEDHPEYNQYAAEIRRECGMA